MGSNTSNVLERLLKDKPFTSKNISFHLNNNLNFPFEASKSSHRNPQLYCTSVGQSFYVQFCIIYLIFTAYRVPHPDWVLTNVEHYLRSCDISGFLLSCTFTVASLKMFISFSLNVQFGLSGKEPFKMREKTSA